jgi:hypothetical protein
MPQAANIQAIFHIRLDHINCPVKIGWQGGAIHEEDKVKLGDTEDEMMKYEGWPE